MKQRNIINSVWDAAKRDLGVNDTSNLSKGDIRKLDSKTLNKFGKITQYYDKNSE